MAPPAPLCYGDPWRPARHLARGGHYLPAAVYPQVADEVQALADRAATAALKAS
jgi:hypothetical protein